MSRSLTVLRKLAPLACACLLVAGAHARGRARQQPQQSVNAPTGEAARGIELFKGGDFAGAVTALRAATKKDKADADAWHYLGLALVKQLKPKDARKALENAARLRPAFVGALNGLVYTLIEQNDLKQAKSVVESSFKIEPENAETHYLRGNLSLRSNSFGPALEEAEASLRIDPNYAHAHFLKAGALVGMGGEELAAANKEKGDARAALLLKIASRVEEAKGELAKFSKLDPSSRDVAQLGEKVSTLSVYAEMFGAPVSERTIFSPKDVTSKAVITDRPEPLYTEKARRNQITGAVRVKMVLAPDGTVKYAIALSRLPDGLTEQALAAARRIKFIPAVKDGRPVSQYVTIDYNFNIY
jgi:TonB family protein